MPGNTDSTNYQEKGNEMKTMLPVMLLILLVGCTANQDETEHKKETPKAATMGQEKEKTKKEEADWSPANLKEFARENASKYGLD